MISRLSLKSVSSNLPSSKFQVVFTPGLLLPYHLYHGVVYQLVCYSPCNGDFNHLLSDEMSTIPHVDTFSRPKLLVLASGGEFLHLIERFKPPKEFLEVQ